MEERGRSAAENRELRGELYDTQLALERTAYEITGKYSGRHLHRWF